jgi:small subunit ribosomal protein S24e
VIRMELTIQSENEMEILSRKDYVFRIAFEGATPSRADILKAITANLKSKRELTIVREIDSVFGEPSCTVVTSVYKDDAALQTYEPEYVRLKHEKIFEAEKAAAEAAKQAEEEAKAAAEAEKAEGTEESADAEEAKEGDAE